MLFKTHVMFALSVYLLLSYYIEMPLTVLIFVLVATMIVDVDIKNSKVGKGWYFRPLQWLTTHRGFLHSLPIGLLVSLIIGGVNLWAGFGFFVGYVSHLFLDCLTLAGVRLFWPLKFKIKGFAKSGGLFEQILFVLLLIGNVAVVVKVIFGKLF